MTNQMKKILLSSMILSITVFSASLTFLFVGGVGYSYGFSYAILGFSALSSIIFTVFYIKVLLEEKKYKKLIYNAKYLLKLREKALLDFYKRFGIKPQYNEKGELLTPDELLKFIVKYDKDGKRNLTIYEILGIEPVFDENGKEVPAVIVLKHLIKKIKTEKLKDVKKLKGLYLKGSKKEKKKEDKKAQPNKEKPAGKSKKGSGGKKKPAFSGISFKPPEIGPYKAKPSNKEKPKTAEEKPQKQEQTKEKITQEIKQESKPQTESAEQSKTDGSSYYSRMFANGGVNKNNSSSEKKSGDGEFTME